MITVNRKCCNDNSNRYMMEKIISVRIADNKTKISNLNKIAKSINFPKSLILKFLGTILHTTVNTDEYIINKNIDNDNVLKEYLYDFIDDFKICKECHNPETTPTIVTQNIIHIKKDKQVERLYLTCSGCSESYEVSQKSIKNKNEKAYKNAVKDITKFLKDNNNAWLSPNGSCVELCKINSSSSMGTMVYSDSFDNFDDALDF